MPCPSPPRRRRTPWRGAEHTAYASVDDLFDLVLIDPPYDVGEDEIAGVLAALAEGPWLAPGALVVVERSTRSPQPRWPTSWTAEKVRRYGETALWLAGC